MSNVVLLGTGVLCLCFLWPSSQVGRTGARAQDLADEPLQNHFVRSDALRAKMREFEQGLSATAPEGRELPGELNDALAQAALAIANNAAEIPRILAASGIDAVSARLAAELTETLRAEAGVLAALATEGRKDEISAQFDRLTHVCASCHYLFRDPDKL